MPALATEENSAPRVRRLATATQLTTGPTEIDADTRVGVFVLTLRANNTGLTFSESPRPGQVMLFAVRQGQGAPYTWTPAPSMKFAGGSPGPTSTVQGHRDLYTFIYDGNDWNETSRALDVN